MTLIGAEEDSLAAEQSVLGSVLINPECLDEIVFLEDRDFTSQRHQSIYKVMRYLYDNDKPVDVVSLTDYFKTRNRLEIIGGGPTYLIQLSSSVPSIASVKYYAEIVRSNSFRKRGIQTGQKIVTLSREDFESDEEYFSAVEALIDELRPQKMSSMRSFSEGRTDYYQHIHGKAEKMMSGFEQFDKWAQIWRGWLYVIAGRPSVGKTAKALQLAVGIARQRKEVDMLLEDLKDAGVVMIFSQEMDENELKDRMVANIATIDYNRLINKGGKQGFTENELKKIDEAYALLETLPIYIQDKAGITIDEIRATARRFKKKHGKIAAIIVDYLQIMNIPQRKNENRSQAIGRVTSEAKQIARKLNCCFIMLSQMTRDSEKSEKPMLSHLKESGSIEQDADVVEFLWHDPNDREPGGKVIQSTFAKGRNIGLNEFRYLFKGWCQRYEELPNRK